MKKSLLLLTALLISVVTIAQTAYPWYPYWNEGVQEAWTVPTEKTTEDEADFVGTVNATWTRSAAFFDQADNGVMPTMANDTAAKVFVTGATEKTFKVASHPRKVSETADFTSGAAWKGSLNVFDTRNSKTYYSVNFPEAGDYMLYLRIQGDVGSKYAIKLTKQADYTGVNWAKDFGTINLAGLTASSNVGDLTDDGKAQYVGLAQGKADGVIGETSYNRNSTYWFKALENGDGKITITDPGTYILFIDHSAGGSFTALGSFTILKVPLNAPPIVSIVEPENNLDHKSNVELKLTAEAEAIGTKTIAGVEFFNNDTVSLGEATAQGDNLWSLNWTPTVEAIYSITAVATDSKDSITASAPITINVADIPEDVWADSIPNDSLIITEIMLSAPSSRFNYAYMEVTNMSTRTMDLSRYFTYHPNSNGGSNMNNSNNNDGDATDFQGRLKIQLKGFLAPGESHVIFKRGYSGLVDGYGMRRYPEGVSNAGIEAQADRITGDYNSGLEGISQGNGIFILGYNQALAYVKLNGDSSCIDIFGPTVGDPVTTNNKPGSTDISEVTIAGQATNDPVRDFVWVRKYDVKTGSANFDKQRGVDEADSEWIPLPRSMQGEFDHAFTTIGNHGSSTALDITSDIADIDLENMVITLPYGVARDSIFRQFSYGENHAWSFTMGPDTSQFFMQTADTLHFFVAGEGVSGKYDFHVNVLPKTETFAQVRPSIYQNTSGNWTRRYTVSQGELPMDSIGNIPYHESIDTFIAYMELEPDFTTAEGLSWEIIPANGKTSPEIEYNDILEVTSTSGEKKQYRLATNTFFPSHDATLSCIIFPGLNLFENPLTFEYTDTLLEFVNDKLSYTVKLPMGTKLSPAIIGKANNARAKVEVLRARNLAGSQADKTAIVRVTAEDDTTIQDYTIYFDLERETPPVKGSLFLSELARGWGRYSRNNAQIFNPTDEYIDLSEYAFIILDGGNGFGDLINKTVPGTTFKDQNAQILRPGYKVVEIADVEGSKVVFEADLIQNSLLLEPKGVYAMAATMAYPMGNPGLKDFAQIGADSRALRMGSKLDIWLDGPGKIEPSYGDYGWWKAWCDLWDLSYDPYGTQCLLMEDFDFASTSGKSFLITKIVNDSIKDGTKSVAKSIEDIRSDYEYVDVFNGETGTADWSQYDNDTIISWTSDNNYRFMRKPHVYKGVTQDMLSFGIGDSTHTVLPSEWDLYQGNVRFEQEIRFGNHDFLSTAHISYLTSIVYVLGEGIVGPQDAYGVEANTTASDFLNNVILTDTGMTVKFFNADNSPKAMDAIMNVNDYVWSYSATGLDSVQYIVKAIGPLSDDCSLTSSDFNVTKDGNEGLISNIPFGTTIKELLATLTPAANASMIQTNGGEVILPLEFYNRDTIKIQSKTKVDALVSEAVYIEVVAQNKLDTCLYSIEFTSVDNPYLLSDVYVIDNEEKVINFAQTVTPDVFLSNLIVSPGATAIVVNKNFDQRTDGIMKYDDRIKVMKGGIAVYYYINYTVEENINKAGSDVNVAVKKVDSNSIGIYPNPTTDFVTLQGFSNISKVSVYDLSGKILKTSSSVNDNSLIDFRAYPKGIYMLRVNSNEGVTTLKLVKE